jgi:hypothetical protein
MFADSSLTRTWHNAGLAAAAAAAAAAELSPKAGLLSIIVPTTITYWCVLQQWLICGVPGSRVLAVGAGDTATVLEH